eukprot:7954814-Pyramimonas_sp.AAC.1
MAFAVLACVIDMSSAPEMSTTTNRVRVATWLSESCQSWCHQDGGHTVEDILFGGIRSTSCYGTLLESGGVRRFEESGSRRQQCQPRVYATEWSIAEVVPMPYI